MSRERSYGGVNGFKGAGNIGGAGGASGVRGGHGAGGHGANGGHGAYGLRGGEINASAVGEVKNRMVSFLAGFIVINGEKRKKLASALERAGMNTSVERYYAEALLISSVFCLCSAPFFYAGFGVAAFGTLALGVAVFFQKIGDVDVKLKRIRQEIIDELPRFISVINYSLSTTRDLVKILEKYLSICKPALKPDLQLLVAEMKSGNYSEALKRFDIRIGIPQLSAFVSGLIDTDRGIDQRTFFYLMEENMNALFIENKKKEIAKRPKKIRKAVISVGVCLFALYIVPIAVQLVDGLNMFK